MARTGKGAIHFGNNSQKRKAHVKMRQKPLTLEVSESTVSLMQLESCQEKPAMLFSEAAAEWLSSKMFQGTTNGRHKYIGQRTLRDYTEYTRNLGRFFGQTALTEI